MADQVVVEGFTLLMSNAEAAALCAAHGWEHHITDKDERYQIAPDAPVDNIWLKFEGGRLVSIVVEYRDAQPARARAFGAALPIQKEARVMGMGVWGSFSTDRTIAVVGDSGGRGVSGVHLGLLADQREVESLIATYGDGLMPPARA